MRAQLAPLDACSLPLCVCVTSTEDLAVGGALKSAYRRFKRLGNADKHGKVSAAGFARALRVKETPFLRKLLQCWDRDGVRHVAVFWTSVLGPIDRVTAPGGVSFSIGGPNRLPGAGGGRLRVPAFWCRQGARCAAAFRVQAS